MCVVLFYQTECLITGRRKVPKIVFNLVLLFCLQYLFLVASAQQPAGQSLLRSFSFHASRSSSLGTPGGLGPVETLVLIFCLLLARLQDLRGKAMIGGGREGKCGDIFTWKEHISVSSTDIMPPALSNSPQ